MPINRVKEAIQEIKKGNMIIMMDDEDRENEGDLVYASIFSTPDKVNFMATHARGLICTPISQKIANKLELTPMIVDNKANHETAFTISVDAIDATTGISASERDMTIKILSDISSSPNELVAPGHIFPLIAKDGGVLVRTGHTEGSVDICTLAGLSPSAVICEIINEDGTMARKPDLELFAKEHSLKIVYISDIVEYRLKNESMIRKIDEKTVDFYDIKADKISYSDNSNNIHTVYRVGNIETTSLVKFHTIKKDIEILTNKTKLNSYLQSIEAIKKDGGVLILLDRENSTSEQVKDYGIGAQILNDLGITKIRLLTTSIKHDFIGISGFGLDIIEEIIS
jgi:3,4-dihydroxy 2-butanone 4-phosphate synthase/GTP cyclohydrolase II